MILDSLVLETFFDLETTGMEVKGVPTLAGLLTVTIGTTGTETVTLALGLVVVLTLTFYGLEIRGLLVFTDTLGLGVLILMEVVLMALFGLETVTLTDVA